MIELDCSYIVCSQQAHRLAIDVQMAEAHLFRDVCLACIN